MARFVRFHETPEAGGGGLPVPTFAVMIARSRDGAVLVFNRRRAVWELPGGFIDAGELPRRGAERELAEEAGCIARDTEWLGLVEVNDGQAHFGAVFRCAIDAVPAHFENLETVGLARWRRGEAPAPLGHADAALLERFA